MEAWSVERGINDFDIVAGNSRLAGYIQSESHADLMAAAPDLLAACKDALNVAECNCQSPCAGTCTHAILAKAVDRAEGRQ